MSGMSPDQDVAVFSMHARWILSTIVAMAVVVMSVAAYLALLGPVAGVREDDKVRLAINPFPGYEPLYLAHVREFFRLEGLNVDLVQFGSLDDARRSFERGQVDAIATTLVDVIQIYRSTGEQPKVVLVTDYSDGADVIVARGPGITSPRDLKGKRVVVEQMFGRYVLQSALRKHGLKLDDVNQIEASVLDGSGMLERGQADAIVTYAPQSIATEAVPGARRIYSSTESPAQILDVVAVRASVFERIPDLQERLVAVWGRALDELSQHPEESIRVMARRDGLSEQEFREALRAVHLVEEDRQAEMLQAGGPVQVALGHIAAFDGWTSPVTRPTPETGAFLVSPRLVGSAVR